MATTIAIIPARSGSERIPRKNIRNFHCRPMIGWSIERAKHSNLFDRIIVSTDDSEIAEVSVAEGAEVPFFRPKDLADNYTGVMPVIRQTLEKLQEDGFKTSEICLIYATAPFIRVEDLKRGQTILREHNCDYVLAVTTFSSPIQRALKITSSGSVAMLQPEHSETRTQDLEHVYRDAGQFCWGTSNAWLNERIVFGGNTYPIEIYRPLVQDIDDPEDWTTAEWMYRALIEGGMYG